MAQRRTELTQALDAVAARGQPELASRAAELRRRVDALAPPAGAAEAARYDGSRSAELQLGQASRSAELQLGPDAVALDRALSSLDEPIRVLGRMSDPAARFEAAQLAGGRAVARQYLGGLSPDDVDARRREMLAVLDAVSRAGGPAIAGRVAELRHRVLAVSSPQDGEASLRRERREAALLRDRLRLELELGETARRFGPSTAPRGSDVEVRTRLDSVRARLALLRAGPRPAAALDDAMQRRFGQELEMLMDACTNCHTMTGPRLDPVIVAQPTLERSRFTHRPHVTQTGCVTCHKMVEESRRAADANITGVDTCRQCHGASKAPERCTTCHVYHPKSLAHLLPAL